MVNNLEHLISVFGSDTGVLTGNGVGQPSMCPSRSRPVLRLYARCVIGADGLLYSPRARHGSQVVAHKQEAIIEHAKIFDAIDALGR